MMHHTRMLGPICLSLLATGLSGCAYFSDSVNDEEVRCPNVNIPDDRQPFDFTARKKLQRLIERGSDNNENSVESTTFVRLNEQGSPLTSQQAKYESEPWSCVSDARTGLTWEVKTDNLFLRDMQWVYTWYEPASTDKQGYAGKADGGKCHEGSACDTQAYVAAINAQKLCGYDDWRLPKTFELHTLLDRSRNCPGTCIDTHYFPNTAKGGYWTSMPFDEFICYAWGIDFELDAASGANKNTPLHIRLVRGKWLISPPELEQ